MQRVFELVGSSMRRASLLFDVVQCEMSLSYAVLLTAILPNLAIN